MLLLFGLISFLIGIIMGGVIIWFVTKQDPIGTIRVDSSEPGEAPLMFLELDNRESLGIIFTSYKVMLRVKKEDIVPHK